jgi:hypothetical protein
VKGIEFAMREGEAMRKDDSWQRKDEEHCERMISERMRTVKG